MTPPLSKCKNTKYKRHSKYFSKKKTISNSFFIVLVSTSLKNPSDCDEGKGMSYR